MAVQGKCQVSMKELRSSENFCLTSALAINLRETNDTYTYSHKIVLIANLPKEP